MSDSSKNRPVIPDELWALWNTLGWRMGADDGRIRRQQRPHHGALEPRGRGDMRQAAEPPLRTGMCAGAD